MLCSLQEPATAPNLQWEKKYNLKLCELCGLQPVSPGFDVGLSLVTMRVVVRNFTVHGSLDSVSSLVKMFSLILIQFLSKNPCSFC